MYVYWLIKIIYKLYCNKVYSFYLEGLPIIKKNEVITKGILIAKEGSCLTVYVNGKEEIKFVVDWKRHNGMILGDDNLGWLCRKVWESMAWGLYVK